MGAEHTKAGRFRAKTGGIIGAGVILAWFWSPLLRYLHPGLLFTLGLLLACMCLMAWDDAVGSAETTRADRRLIKWSGIGMLIAAAAYVFITTNKLDDTCRDIQKAMLHGRVGSADTNLKVSDPADVFQALGCRPQFLPKPF